MIGIFIFQKTLQQDKYRNFWNMEYSRNISKKYINNRNIENLGIWNIPWNIPKNVKQATGA